ncbi:MAG: thioredoxin [Nitrososphaerota archaeon]|nr:thioredoxin [Nitrososphaerota archaeon]MDG6966162.1 thioredoxin [Nitrososphaerota archaeon]MDG6977597.1 thioredoxin [Nitrososphaerota archaeon]MDG7020351.1 thioredoxin [Nitrososphaerota archaeon]MDG7022734.1 thioredoxin [Nitrososphaerota archaeon]
MSQDEELERLNKRKLEDLVQRKTRLEEERSAPPAAQPMQLTDSTFGSEVARHQLMVVDFWAPWCGPCRMVGPVIEQLAREYSGRVAFGKLNVDENPMVSQTFGIQSIPTILFFKDGKAIDGVLGAVPKAYIENKLAPYLPGTGSSSAYG